jgi:hypothetical protein
MGAQKTYALILGLVLLIVGIWGFFVGTGNVLIFGVNTAQSVLHVIAGLFGIYVGTKGQGRGYNSSIGWIGIILGILGFIPVVGHNGGYLASWLNINPAITYLHLVIGVLSLLIYYAVKE